MVGDSKFLNSGLNLLPFTLITYVFLGKTKYSFLYIVNFSRKTLLHEVN